MNRFLQTSLVAFATGLFICGNVSASSNIIFQSKLSPYEFVSATDFRTQADKENHSKLNLLAYLKHRVYEKNANDIQKLREEKELEEQIAEEIRLGEIELLAQLVEAEAGNQDLKGKRLVADVVLNRIDKGWGDSIEQIIFMDKQFSCINDGGFDRAAWHMSNESFDAARIEYEASRRLDSEILYFTAGYYNVYCKPLYRYGAHYFGR